jgi:mRNA interferase RelE/StbE
VAKSRYQLQVDNLLIKDDLPLLPMELLEDFAIAIKPLLQLDPLNLGGVYATHALAGNLQGYRAVEIDFDSTAYRLVYRIYEKPSPRRVVVLSFAEHDPAYKKAKQRRKIK